jgi:hypothetical protein
MSALEARNRYINSLNHIDSAYGKIKGMVGRGRALTFPDVYKLTEGLFLNSWTYWEAFLRDVLWNDLATDQHGVLLKDMAVKGNRTRGPHRLAELILNHPDSPEKFVDWADYGAIKKRAIALLGPGHRFTNSPPQLGDIEKLKRIRNAIAHKSDRAWDSFMSLARSAPFSLTIQQTRGLTPGRFLYAHTWNNVTVMDHASHSLRQAALTLVP